MCAQCTHSRARGSALRSVRCAGHSHDDTIIHSIPRSIDGRASCVPCRRVRPRYLHLHLLQYSFVPRPTAGPLPSSSASLSPRGLVRQSSRSETLELWNVPLPGGRVWLASSRSPALRGLPSELGAYCKACLVLPARLVGPRSSARNPPPSRPLIAHHYTTAIANRQSPNAQTQTHKHPKHSHTRPSRGAPWAVLPPPAPPCLSLDPARRRCMQTTTLQPAFPSLSIVHLPPASHQTVAQPARKCPCATTEKPSPAGLLAGPMGRLKPWVYTSHTALRNLHFTAGPSRRNGRSRRDASDASDASD